MAIDLGRFLSSFSSLASVAALTLHYHLHLRYHHLLAQLLNANPFSLPFYLPFFVFSFIFLLSWLPLSTRYHRPSPLLPASFPRHLLLHHHHLLLLPFPFTDIHHLYLQVLHHLLHFGIPDTFLISISLLIYLSSSRPFCF